MLSGTGSYPDLLATAADPILVVAGDAVVAANEAALTLTGYDREGILHTPFLDLILPDEREWMHSCLGHAPGEGPVQTVLVGRGGSLHSVEVTILPTSVLGRIAFVLVLRVRPAGASSAGPEVEENLRFLIENGNDGFLVTSAEGRYIYANRRITELLGYSLAELLTLPYWQILHPDEVPKVRGRFISRIKGAPAPRRYETRAVARDGTVIPVELTAMITSWGSRLADVIIVRDLTLEKQNEARRSEERTLIERLQGEVEERRRVENALRASEAWVRDVANASGEYFFELNRQGRVSYVSERVATILGYPPEELLGSSPFDFDVPEPAPPEDRTVEQLLELDDPRGRVLIREQHVLRKDGGEVWLQVHIVVVRDESGKPTGFRGTALDITAQKQAFAALRRRDAILETVTSSVEGLLATPDPMDAMETLLERFGTIAGAERAGLYLMNADGTPGLSRVRSWADPEHEFPGPDEVFRDIPVSLFPAEWVQSVARGVPLRFSVNQTSGALAERLLRTQSCSNLVVPVLVDGRLWGILGFSNRSAEAEWQDPEVEALRLAGAVLGAVIRRQNYEAALRRKDRILEAVAYAAERLLTSSEWDRQIPAVLEQLGTAAEADQASLYEAEPGDAGEILGNRSFVWTAASTSTVGTPEQFRGLPLSSFFGKEQMESLRRGGPISIGFEPRDLADPLPWERCRTILVLPIRVDSELWGALGFSSISGAPSWQHPEREALQAAASLIGAAVLRSQISERIQSYQERLRSLTSELALTEQRERRRIAVALHDRIGQYLAITKIKLSQLRYAASIPAQRSSLGEIWELVNQTIQDTRTLTFELSPPVLYELGLESALEWLTEQSGTRYGWNVSFHDDGQPKPLGEDLRGLLFQAAQELLVNVAKHASAREVRVSVRREGNEICCEVTDDGCGFDPSVTFPAGAGAVSGAPGFGLFSIRERLGPFGGRLELRSSTGKGTRAALWGPLRG